MLRACWTHQLCKIHFPVYVAEMQQLDEKQPLMYRHMIEGGFVVRRSKSRVFICMPTAQALEQMRILSQCQDPFNHDDIPESLVNITTGQVASEEVENSLWNIPKKEKTVAD